MTTVLPELVLVDVDGEPWGAAEVLTWGALCGELESHWQRTGRQLARAPSMAKPELQAALDAFRVQRGLTAADDFKAWLAKRSLGLGEVASFLRRQHVEPGEGWAEPGDVLWGEVCCRGLVDRWMVGLGRALAVYADDAPGPVPPATGDPLRAPTAHEARLRQVAAHYRAREASLLTEDRLLRLLEASRLELVSFELEGLETPDEDVALEVVQCLRTDGRPLEDTAALAGVTPWRRQHFSEELPRSLQRDLLGAAPGQVLGPVPVDGGQQVVRLVRKTLPSLANDRVREVLANRVRASAFAGAVEHRMQWPSWRPVTLHG